MDIKEINLIGEKEFYWFNFPKTMEVLQVIETIRWTNRTIINNQGLVENNGLYNRFLDIAEEKVHQNKFEELVDNESKKYQLLLYISQIRMSIAHFRLATFYDEIKDESENTRTLAREDINIALHNAQINIQAAVRNANADIQTAVCNANTNIKEELRNQANSFETNLQAKTSDVIGRIEPQLMTTILTLMGVFSAIITIVMSVVITSSSWLNNADGASAVIAFIIPNFVAIAAIVILLGIVFNRRRENVIVIPSENWEAPQVIEKKLKKQKRLFYCTIVFIILWAIILVGVALYEIDTSQEPHTRYVLSQGMYECTETQDEKTNEVSLVIKFEINGKDYIIPYQQNYFHDGKLYFCEEHNQLE